MIVGILYNPFSNLASLCNILSKLNCEFRVIKNKKDFDNINSLIMPGVGSFAEVMSFYHEHKIYETIKQYVINRYPILGICLGMQLLVCTGYEQKKTSGFGFIKGEVRPIIPKIDEMKIHIGWNNVNFKHSSSLFKNIEQDSDFYFVHSFHVVTEKKNVLANTDYGNGVVASLESDNIFGVQFHPEKSQKRGQLLIKNFLKIASNA